MNPPVFTPALLERDQTPARPVADAAEAKVVAVIVARCQSPESPQAILSDRSLITIAEKTVLEWIASRLEKCRRVKKIVVATTADPQDVKIIAEAKRLGLGWYRGSAEFVMERLHTVARKEKAGHIVRVNGNFPLVDAAATDDLIEEHLAIKADFSYNSHYHGLIYGMGVEVISTATLDRLGEMNISYEQKTLGGLFVTQNPELFRILALASERRSPGLRVSVDYHHDIRLIESVLEADPEADQAKVIDILEARPDLVVGQSVPTSEEVGLEKILIFPEKVRNLHRNNCATVDETYPISVEMSLTNRCNHFCKWCSDADLRDRQDGEMDRETLFGLLGDLEAGGTRGVTIEGGGEPTMHREFLPVVARARGLDLHLGLISNGYMLPYADQVSDFDWIRISLDSATAEQYHGLKGVDGFDRVINNLMTLTERSLGTAIGVGYVVCNQNDDPAQLEALVRLLRKIGVSYIHFRPVVDHPEMDSARDLCFLKKYETENFAVMTGAMVENRAEGNNNLPCLAHSLSSVVTADGSVFICGRLNIYDFWEPIGNLHERSFSQIWRSDKRRDQVRLLSDRKFCLEHCPRCRMTKYNELLNKMARIKTRNFI